MNAELIKCPACAAPLTLTGTEEVIRCGYCGHSIRIKQRNVNPDGSLPIKDNRTGIPIASVRLPFGYKTNGALVPQPTNISYPLGIWALANNDKGISLTYYNGESFTDRSHCPMLSSSYTQGMDAVSKTEYRDFMEAESYADNYVINYAKQMNATDLRYTGEREMPIRGGFDRQTAVDQFISQVRAEKEYSGSSALIDLGLYLKGVCRTYSMSIGGAPCSLAIMTVLRGWKSQLPNTGFGMSGMGGLFGGMLGINPNLNNSMFGNSILGRIFAKNEQPRNAEPQQTSSDRFSDMPQNSFIDWGSDGVFMLLAPSGGFEEAFQSEFMDFCSDFRIDDGLKVRIFDMQAEIRRNIARFTQQRIDTMNRQFQTWQQLNAAQQAAYDANNKAWWDRTNAADAARRSNYSSGSGADKFSEAMRGVNTYIRPDGTEVEVSVDYDRAYTNASNDTLGSKSAFEPGGNWTEMHRKW